MKTTASVVATALLGVGAIFAGPVLLAWLVVAYGWEAGLIGLGGIVWAATLWPYVRAEIATDWDNAKQQARIAQVIGRR